ncbi:hypothetical protein [Ekhidna sp.]
MRALQITKYLVPFTCLTILCGTTHEFAHHFSGAIVCGCFGFKTFNSFQLCAGCESNPYWLVPTYIGPLFTFLLLWIGRYQLKQESIQSKQLGFALIFANFPVNRILFALMGMNDEQYAASILFGNENTLSFWVTNLAIWLFTIPPLYTAYCSIKSPKRILIFLLYFIIPFAFVIIFAGFLLEEWLLLKKQFLSSTIIGIPLLLILVEIVCVLGYYFLKKHIYQQPLVKLK